MNAKLSPIWKSGLENMNECAISRSAATTVASKLITQPWSLLNKDRLPLTNWASPPNGASFGIANCGLNLGNERHSPLFPETFSTISRKNGICNP